MKMIAFTALLLAATAAHAADLDVQVNGPDGKPIADAVVTVHLAGRPTPAPRLGASYAVDQQDIQFHPFVTLVPVGARVSFLNHDAVRHHVYSFSPAKKFELKLEQRQEDRTVVFDKAGVVPLGCNIHDKMIAFVDVVDTPWAARTGPDGRVHIKGVPAGAVSIELWHPYLRSPRNMMTRPATLTDAPHREIFVAPLRAAPRAPAIADY